MKPIEAKRKLEERYKNQNEYNREKYDRVSVMFPAGYRDIVRTRAGKNNQSLNAFILEAVREKMGDMEEKNFASEKGAEKERKVESLEELQAIIDARKEEIKNIE